MPQQVDTSAPRVREIRIEGKGRATPGPSPAASRRAVTRIAVFVAAWLATSASAAGKFVFGTTTVGKVDPAAVVAVAAAAGSVLLLAVHARPLSHRVSDTLSRRPVLLDAFAVIAASLVAQIAAPLVVFANRYSDAPTGAIVAFWTTGFWGFALVLAGVCALRPTRVRLLMGAAGLLALTAAAGVLGNWERPSSFSLLTRFTSEQLTMAGTGLVWAASIWLIVSIARDRGWLMVSRWVGGAGLLGAAALVLLAGVVPDLTRLPVTVWIYAMAAAAALVLTTSLGAVGRLELAGSALAFAPALISLLTLLEAAVGMLGPQPILVGPVMWATVAGAAAMALILASRDSIALDRDATVPDGNASQPWTRLLGLGATVAVLAAVLALVSPGVAVSVRGGFSGGERFAADFVLEGARTVGGWLVLSFALIALGAVHARPAAAGSVMALLTTAAGGASWLVLRYTPLHTWMTWVPAEVQQDFGTEYASIVFSEVSVIWQSAALVIALAVCVALAGRAVVASAQSRASDEGEPS